MERVSSKANEKLKVFISYSRRERPLADALFSALEASDFDAIIDRRDLPYGEEWQTELADFIRASDTVVWLVSPASVLSQWCNWELGEVIRLNKRLIPVRVGDVDPASLPQALGKIHLLPAEGLFSIEQQLPVLCDVLNTDRAWVKDATRLADRARQWLAKGRDRGLLLFGSALKDAETWSTQKPRAAPAPASEILELILASRRGAVRRQRWAVVGAMAVAALALGLAGLAYWQRNIAQENERQAEASQRRAEASQREAEASQRQAEAERDRALLARARAMGSLSNQLRSEGDVLRSALVAIEAAERAHAVKADAAPVLGEIEESLLGSLSQLREQVFVDLKSGIVRSTAFSPDGTKLVAATDKGAQIVDAATGKVLHRFDDGRRVSTAAFSPDGTTILTGGQDETAFLWDARTGAQLGDVIRGHPKSVWDVRFSPDGTQFLTTAADGKIRVWDAKRRTLLFALGESPKDKTSDDTVRMAVFTSDGKQIVACHQENGTVRVWDLATRKIAAEFKSVEPEVYSASMSPDGTLIAIGGWSGDASIFEMKTRKKTRTLKGQEAGLFTLAFSPDGKRIATGGRDATIRLWEASSGENVAVMRGHVASVYRVAFSPDGRKLTSASADGQVRVWDATFAVESRMRPGDPTLQPAREESEGQKEKKFDSYSADGSKALRVDDSDLYVTEVWDVRADKRIASIRGLSGVVNAANFSPDGSKVVTAERNGLAQVWNTHADKLQFHLRGHSDQMQDAQFSPDGKLIATAGRDATARLWDAHTGTQVFVYRGHNQPVDSVSFSPDSSKLMTSGADGRIRIWSTRSGVEILSLRTHDADQGASSSSAAFSKDGRFVFVETIDEKSGTKAIEVGLSVQELVERAIAASSRCLTLEQRQQMSLDRDPPHWCIELEKWPYNAPEWKQWLAEKKAGSSAAFPKSP